MGMRSVVVECGGVSPAPLLILVVVFFFFFFFFVGADIGCSVCLSLFFFW